MTKIPETTELNRLEAAKADSQAIGEFLDWLNSRKIVLCKLAKLEEAFVPIDRTNEQLLAEYFNINLRKVERERRALLDYIRKNQW